jgi:geranylgeranyl pyrophosphate synthase
MVQTVIAEKGYESVSRHELTTAVERAGALDCARARADEYAAAAQSSLDNLPDSPHCESLRSIPTYVLDRER